MRQPIVRERGFLREGSWMRVRVQPLKMATEKLMIYINWSKDGGGGSEG